MATWPNPFRDAGSDKQKRRPPEGSDSDKGIELSDLELADPGAGLGGGSLVSGSHLFGQFDKKDVENMLRQVGLFARLDRLGYHAACLELDILSPLDQRILILTGPGCLKPEKSIHEQLSELADQILVHLRLKLSEFTPRPGVAEIPVPAGPFLLIYIDWLLLQDPGLKIPRQKGGKPAPLFPGQNYPGLGLYREVTSFIEILAHQVRCDGVLNAPDFFHDAVLFANRFDFLHPSKEALFRNLLKFRRRPVFKATTSSNKTRENKMSLRQLSQSIVDGRLEINPRGKTGENHWQPFEWPHGEMISPLNPALKKYLESPAYRQAVARYQKNIAFRLA